MNGFEGLTEEELQSILELAGLTAEEDIISQQMARADMLRSAPTPRGYNTGRMYQAAHPLEHLSAALTRGMGTYQTGKLEETRRGIEEQRRVGRENLLRALFRNQQQPASQPSAGMQNAGLGQVPSPKGQIIPGRFP